MQSFVSKCGYSKSMALAIRFGPKSIGGAGFTPLWVVQTEGQIMNFLKEWRTKGFIGDLFRIAVAWAQYSAGTSTPIFQNPKVPLPHMESRYIKSLRNNLAAIGGSLELDKVYVPPTLRENDKHIFDILLETQRFSDKELHLLNYCRLYLGVVTLADIILPDGETFDEDIEQGVLSCSSCRSNYLKANQARPNPATWKLWTQRAYTYFRRYIRSLPNHRLGRWTVTADESRQLWPAYLDVTDDSLYVRKTSNDDTFDYCSYDYDDQWSCERTLLWSPHKYCVPVQVDPSGDGEYLVYENYAESVPQPVTPEPANFLE